MQCNMKTGSFEVATVFFFNAIVNTVLISGMDRNLITDLGNDVKLSIIVILFETTLSSITVVFIYKKRNSCTIIAAKYFLLGCMVGLILLDMFYIYSIVQNLYQRNLNSDEKIEENIDLHDLKITFSISVLGISLICYFVWKLYVVAKTVSFASDRKNLILTTNGIDVQETVSITDHENVPLSSSPPSYDQCLLMESTSKDYEAPPPSYDEAVTCSSISRN